MRSSGYPRKSEEGRGYLRDLLSTAAYRFLLAFGGLLILYGTALSSYALAVDASKGVPLSFSAASLAFALLALCLFACQIILEGIYRKGGGLSFPSPGKALLLLCAFFLAVSSFLLLGTYEEEGAGDSFLLVSLLIVGGTSFLFLLASSFLLLWRKENPRPGLRKTPSEEEGANEVAKKG